MYARSVALLLFVLALESGCVHARRLPHVDPKNWPITHFLVLMEENRSFDHMLGAMKVLLSLDDLMVQCVETWLSSTFALATGFEPWGEWTEWR